MCGCQVIGLVVMCIPYEANFNPVFFSFTNTLLLVID